MRGGAARGQFESERAAARTIVHRDALMTLRCVSHAGSAVEIQAAPSSA